MRTLFLVTLLAFGIADVGISPVDAKGKIGGKKHRGRGGNPTKTVRLGKGKHKVRRFPKRKKQRSHRMTKKERAAAKKRKEQQLRKGKRGADKTPRQPEAARQENRLGIIIGGSINVGVGGPPQVTSAFVIRETE